MKTAFNISLQNRKVLYHFLKTIPVELVVKIPDGFKNNILWNIAHIIVVQQRLVYKRSGLEMLISADFVEKYNKGSFPAEETSTAEIEQIQQLLFSTLKKTEEDYQENRFKTFSEFTTPIQTILKNVEDAILFNNYHEGIHLGYILALKKALGI